jgi:type IV pilus assembly protein PilE
MDSKAVKGANMRTHKGFTLIELVVAMVIAAILAAIAIPGYSSYVRKARRADAKTALLDLAGLEERYFSTQNVYTANWSDLGYTAANGSALPVGNYYTIAAQTPTAAVAPTATTVGSPASFSFTATAVLTSDQAKDTQCKTFTVTSGGGQSAADSNGNDNTQTCWH